MIYKCSKCGNVEEIQEKVSQVELGEKTVSQVFTDEVEQLYRIYPKKVARGQALKAIRFALKKDSYENIKAGLLRFCEKIKSGEVNRDFIPHASTWFNGERWTDEDQIHLPSEIFRPKAATPAPKPKQEVEVGAPEGWQWPDLNKIVKAIN